MENLEASTVFCLFGGRHDSCKFRQVKICEFNDYFMPASSAKTNNIPRNFGDKF